MKNIINWKVFFVLLGLSLVSVACVFPYVVSVQGELISKMGVPLTYLFLAQLLQSFILFSVAIFLGLIFTKKVNFKLPLIEAILKKENYKEIFKNIFWKSVLWGVLTALAIYTLDFLFSLGGAGITTHETLAPAWQTLLASVYGGATEEILMRLFLMSFLVWLGMKLFRKTEPTKTGVIIPIFISAIIFGLGHLPITASLTEITALVVLRAIVLNGVGGIVFGWLFWKKGLESAMLAHFTADVFLLTLLPLLIR